MATLWVTIKMKPEVIIPKVIIHQAMIPEEMIPETISKGFIISSMSQSATAHWSIRLTLS